MENGNLDYTIEINDADLLRLVNDIKKAQAEMAVLSKSAEAVAASMSKYTQLDFSKTVLDLQKVGGNKAVKEMLDSAAQSASTAKESITGAGISLIALQRAAMGDMSGVMAISTRFAGIGAALGAVISIVKGVDFAVSALGERLKRPFVNVFKDFYDESATAAQIAMKQNQITMEQFVKDANAAAEGVTNALQEIQNKNSRRSGVEGAASKYGVENGSVSPEQDIENFRSIRVRNARELQDAAQGSFRTVSKHAGDLKSAYDQSEFDYENIRSQAVGSESPVMIEALKKAKDARDKIKNEYESTIKQLEAVRKTLNDTVADANAEIDKANTEAATAFQSRKNAQDKKNAADYLQNAQGEDDARKKRLVSESQYRYHSQYDSMSDEDKLKATNRNIETWRNSRAGATTEKDRQAATEGLIGQLQIRDELKKRIADAAGKMDEKKKEDLLSRADRIKSAQENISKANERRVGGDLAGYFQRMADLRHGRDPKDDASRMTAENTRIIAENTKLLKDLGVVRP